MSNSTPQQLETEYPNVGLCECGCGQPTRLAPMTDRKRGWVKGEPIRFVHGHHRRRAAATRFWEYVNQDTGTNCWHWQSTLNKRGYGRIRNRAVNLMAHRFSWELHNGPIPDGLFVCHSCDNPRCVNPAHLWLGTRQDNMDDMMTKGRGSNPPVRRGDANNNATLTERDVRDIRARVANGETYTAIATTYSIHRSTAADIAKRKTWAHVA
jgi:hypothetical protein